MADQKITELAALNTASADDIIPIVDDPGGTPITKKITVADLIGAKMDNLIDDTTPQLGGDLDANAFNILMDNNTGIEDESGNEQILFSTIASAINFFNISNAATGNGPELTAAGVDSNIDLELSSKGTGIVSANGFDTIASNENFVQAFDTTTQTVASANVFQAVTFSNNAEIDGWTHTAATADFTCNQTGTYIVACRGHIQKSGGGSSFGEMRVTLNGTEVAGTMFGDDLTTNNETKSFCSIAVMAITAADVLNVQLTGNTTNTQLVVPAGNSTTDVSISLTITRIK